MTRVAPAPRVSRETFLNITFYSRARELRIHGRIDRRNRPSAARSIVFVSRLRLSNNNVCIQTLPLTCFCYEYCRLIIHCRTNTPRRDRARRSRSRRRQPRGYQINCYFIFLRSEVNALLRACGLQPRGVLLFLAQRLSSED